MMRFMNLSGDVSVLGFLVDYPVKNIDFIFHSENILRGT